MREVIAVCRSSKKSRGRTARILDRYFWRIGDRTWRGKATNACLDRVARELRHSAKRNTAVTIHEIRSAHESRIPLIRIGSRSAFSEDGLVPVASHPAAVRRGAEGPPAEIIGGAVVRIAALFHDLGKATRLFQGKLRRSLKAAKPEADAVRHELHSAAVWDKLFGTTPDDKLADALAQLTPKCIDKACEQVTRQLGNIHNQPKGEIGFGFIGQKSTLSHLVGMLILTHHRLPEGDSSHVGFLAGRHVNQGAKFVCRKDLQIAEGVPFWHEPWWLTRLRRDAQKLDPGALPASADISLRASLMFADHIGSALKRSLDDIPDHLANTMEETPGGKKRVPADDLSTHVRRVYTHVRGTFDLLHRYRYRFPGLDEGQIPVEVLYPLPSGSPQFLWQAEAAQVARAMCERNEGGFFACLMAGTGTGKTRGAPTILANAAMGDTRPERRYLRMGLGLGLRVLAKQSAEEYVADLGFRNEDVSVLIGQPPLDFDPCGRNEQKHDNRMGSESLIKLPDWLHVEHATGDVPREGDSGEADWLRSLSIDTDNSLPAFCDLILRHAGKRAAVGRRLLAPPIMVGTIDHLMGVASPVNSRFLIQSLRLLTSDLILDEIDQFDGEDIAAIGRLVFQAGASGRRVIIMSATLTPDIAEALHTAYERGWTEFARTQGLSAHVNLLCTSDAPKSCFTNEDGRGLSQVISECQGVTLDGIRSTPAARRGEILPPCCNWQELVRQIDAGCTRMHGLNAAEIEGVRVSAGMVRMTRIAHTAALAAQLPSGRRDDGRLRVVLCLHSQFPRLHRAWIEDRLKRALTRKGDDPDMGLRSLCYKERLFERAVETGAHEIEIVVVTSPVIETGNDLDFDYAILDPNSTRAIIQAAGRVRRHRAAKGNHPNVLILGRSPIVMQDERLIRPGVETRPAEETKVPAQRCLEAYEDRKFTDLAGDEDFAEISAAPILSGAGSFPLRDAEAGLRSKMVCAKSDDDKAPLGLYTTHLNARLNLTMTRTRRFRRADNRDILFLMIGESFEDAEWYLDLAPGTSSSVMRKAAESGLDICKIDGEHLFDDLSGAAWLEYAQSHGELTSSNLKELMRAQIPDYRNDTDPEVTYTEFTGFTRGKKEDLFEPFGKTK